VISMFQGPSGRRIPQKRSAEWLSRNF
jgi:hypothetical protein